MNADSTNFFSDFLSDYFCESDEHLASIRRQLLALETTGLRRKIAPAVFDELLRSFHSLKGLSAMVGAHDVEQLAHGMEDYLRDLEREKCILGQEGMEALVSGTNALEEMIAGRRDHKAVPDYGPVLARFAALATDARIESADAQGHNSHEPRHENPGRPTERTFRFEFRPRPELADRGINVNSVRTRLQGAGRILQAVPLVAEGGGIAFEFLVATELQESEFSDWEADGIHFALHKTAAFSASSQPSDVDHQPQTTPAGGVLSTSNVVRVNMARLDQLMTMVGELVISRGRLEENLRSMESIVPAATFRNFQDINRTMGNQLRDLREGVMNVRMVPIGQVFERMQFVVRSLERESQKDVLLDLTGHETEIDKLLVEKMMDPLLHLVRNAVTHGLESTSERLAQGKTPEGHLRLSATAKGETIVIELEDDGRGINMEKIAERARAAGMLLANERLDNVKLLDVLCEPGFSTRDEADLAAGRGVGMTVVKTTIVELGGSLSMDTRLGEGTRFTIQLPLTLAILHALIVTLGEQRFAVPQSAVREVLRVETQSITVLEKNEIIKYHDGVLPIVRLRRLFRVPDNAMHATHVFVVGSDSNNVGIAVDRILGQREIVVRSVQDPLIHVVGVAGATEIGDGRPMLILDIPAILELARRNRMELRSMPKEKTSADSYILFEVAGSTYAVRSELVQLVEMVEHITPVPNALPFVEGVVFTRGQVVPGINLRVRFGLPKIPKDLRSRMLVVQFNGRNVGMLVDSAREFVSIPAEVIQPPSEAITGLSGNYLKGIATMGERLILILDVEQVVNFSEGTQAVSAGI